jgi:hypothetical protein
MAEMLRRSLSILRRKPTGDPGETLKIESPCRMRATLLRCSSGNALTLSSFAVVSSRM